MTWAWRLLSLVLLLGLQITLGPVLAVDGVSPDVLLSAVLVLALESGPVRGGLAGVVAGLAMDLARGRHIGLLALAAGSAGWLAGEAASRIDPGRPSVRWMLCTACAGLYGLLIAGLWAVLDRHGLDPAGAARHVVVAALYDGSLAAAAYGARAWRRRPAAAAPIRLALRSVLPRGR